MKYYGPAGLAKAASTLSYNSNTCCNCTRRNTSANRSDKSAKLRAERAAAGQLEIEPLGVVDAGVADHANDARAALLFRFNVQVGHRAASCVAIPASTRGGIRKRTC
jgi:hypothetical protein